jgi:hypothetical protein
MLSKTEVKEEDIPVPQQEFNLDLMLSRRKEAL